MPRTIFITQFLTVKTWHTCHARVRNSYFLMPFHIVAPVEPKVAPVEPVQAANRACAGCEPFVRGACGVPVGHQSGFDSPGVNRLIDAGETTQNKASTHALSPKKAYPATRHSHSASVAISQHWLIIEVTSLQIVSGPADATHAASHHATACASTSTAPHMITLLGAALLRILAYITLLILRRLVHDSAPHGIHRDLCLNT